ncbi:MAG: GAF domain-containing protein [Gammaproteobacteria bacterium]|nr:GAF domain-containing protein [Gammaproteobacteria bacterium]
MTVPKPKNESARLEALRAYAILDTPPEDVFDDFTLLAAFICGTPTALVSLVDDERQWFKSKHGMDADETPRDVAFCAHAILDCNVMVIPDATKDPRFVENPLVTTNPGIQFYAGAPLITPEGHVIGALCAIDYSPRELDPRQEAALAALASQVVVQLELRRVSAALADTIAKVELLEGVIPICSYCKSIRNDKGYWDTLEDFMKDYSDQKFSHSICTDCMEKRFPDVEAE